MNLTECEIRSVLFGPYGRVEEWNLTIIVMNAKTSGEDHINGISHVLLKL
jgi:hypothetical protein